MARPSVTASAAVTGRVAEDRPPLDLAALTRLIGPCGARALAEAAADFARWRTEISALPSAGTAP